MFVSYEDFAKLRSRFAAYEACGFPNCDKQMIPVLQVLNSLPGMASVFSCEGHYGYDDRAAENTTYLMIACTQEALPMLAQLFQQLEKRVKLAQQFEISFSRVVWPIGQKIENYTQMLEAKTYNSCCISFTADMSDKDIFEQSKSLFLEDLIASLKLLGGTSKTDYVYRGLPCNVVDQKQLWSIDGMSGSGGGVLEWCTDEDDAVQKIIEMSKYPEFSHLSARKATIPSRMQRVTAVVWELDLVRQIQQEAKDQGGCMIELGLANPDSAGQMPYRVICALPRPK